MGGSLFAGVEELEPGHLLVATHDDLSAKSYWDLDLPRDPQPNPANHHELVAEFRERLAESVVEALAFTDPAGVAEEKFRSESAAY